MSSHGLRRGLRRALLAARLLLLVLLLVVLAPVGAWAHEGGLELTVSPSDLAAGDAVTVSGEGFAPNSTLELHLSGPNGDAHFGDVTVDAEGTFSQLVAIPATIVPGIYLIRATGDREASAELSVGAMAGMSASSDEATAQRDRSAAWKIGAVAAFLGVAVLGMALTRPRRRARARALAA